MSRLMTEGELTIMVTALVGFAGTLVSQWAAAKKADRATRETIALREQDRLDREQAAHNAQLLQEKATQAQMVELELLKTKTAEADAAVRRQMLVSSRVAKIQHQKILGAIDTNNQKLAHNTAISEQAARAIDTANQKLAENTFLTERAAAQVEAAFKEVKRL